MLRQTRLYSKNINRRTIPTTAILGINVKVTSWIEVVAWKIPTNKPTNIAEPKIGKQILIAVIIVSLLKNTT